jgi:putative aldouronate transport system permease protein
MRSSKYRAIIQTTTTLPNFISWVLVYAVFFVFLSPGDGIINQFLLNYGIISKPIDPLSNVDITWYMQTAIGLWKNMGFSAIIYLATIVGIDQELYDAANVDGANRWQTIRHIVVPGLIPTYLNLLILGVGFILSNGFEQYYLFYNELVHDKIQVLDVFLYRVGLMNGDYPLSTALGMTKSLVSVILLFSVNWISKRLRGQSII